MIKIKKYTSTQKHLSPTVIVSWHRPKRLTCRTPSSLWAGDIIKCCGCVIATCGSSAASMSASYILRHCHR